MSPKLPQPKEPRDTLLLSHANPEDNEFTLWLALQLANEGYRVWCDLTKLLGGEVFWDNIEEVIKGGDSRRDGEAGVVVCGCPRPRVEVLPAQFDCRTRGATAGLEDIQAGEAC
jgi:hypothetical protein